MSDTYPLLVSPVNIGGFELSNRIAHASIVTRFVKDGIATQKFLDYHRNRAQGGCGLIVTEPLAMTAVNRVASRLRVWDDQAFDSLQQVAEAVETHGTRLLGQVQDGGRGRHEVGRNDDAVGASALPDDLSWTVPRVLTIDAIRQMIDDWAEGSRRLQRAGWSGVEISAGHGHLFHQFLSPWSNHRDDEFGGDLAGRARLLTELVAAIRAACDQPFMIGIKLPGDDGVPGGIDLDAAKAIASHIGKTCDIDYWTWVWGAHANSLYKHLPDAHGERHPYLDAIRDLRQAAPHIPSGAIGYITDPNECEKALEDGTADIAFLGRPLITDPNFANKVAAGREASIRYCVSCNTCWRSIIEGGHLYCDNNPRVGLPEESADAIRPAKKSRKLAVVGGGIAGLEAAFVAAKRGHAVTLFSNSDEVGGNTRLHAELPGGENLSSIYDYQFLAAKQAGVKFELGVKASASDVAALSPDQVFLATGASMVVPDWVSPELAEYDLVPDGRAIARELLSRSGREAGHAVMLDRDHTEMTYAVTELLASRFEQVTIITPRERVASDVSLINRQGVYERLHQLQVQIITSADIADLDRLEEAEVEAINVYNGNAVTISDLAAITYCTARQPDHELLAPLTALGLPVELVGDCNAPRTVLAATREGHDKAIAL